VDSLVFFFSRFVQYAEHEEQRKFVR